MSLELNEPAEHKEENMALLGNLRFYLRQRPVMLVLLTGVAVIFFLAVTGLSSAYQEQRMSLGNRWFNRGIVDLDAKRFDAAVTDFRAALLYSRDNYEYQLNLAEALIGSKHTGEASAYLLNLWDRKPDDGLVNLELARITAGQGQTQDAIRHYHDAIYAAWPRDEDGKRRDARLELIELLLRTNAKAQAQAELVALAENESEDPAQQQQLGDLFVRTGDFEHALAAYRLSLKPDPRNPAALAGAGNAAFQLGRYPLAEEYLKGAAEADPNDQQSSERLKTTRLVLQMDPFRREIPAGERHKIVVEAFAAAGQRLKACAARNSASATGTQGQPSLDNQWAALQGRVTEQNLRRDPDLVDSAMNLVFQVERQTSVSCGAPTGTDLALLLIAKLHEGN